MIKLWVENVSIVAAVDTGAPYVICPPDLAAPLEPYCTPVLLRSSWWNHLTCQQVGTEQLEISGGAEGDEGVGGVIP
ncbi:MAG: hypothetical protein CVU38_11945 [Chloroflexi bacterium HGW-Chloroflexi-1]|nr:MAG: hypothetical protein CVU38_11945 [Chloroflexi bacterium HGW-Chloroflexi-1]